MIEIILVGILFALLLFLYFYITQRGQVKLPTGSGGGGWGVSCKKSMSRGKAILSGLEDQWKPDGLTINGKTEGYDVEYTRKIGLRGIIIGMLLGAAAVMVVVKLIL